MFRAIVRRGLGALVPVLAISLIGIVHHAAITSAAGQELTAESEAAVKPVKPAPKGSATPEMIDKAIRESQERHEAAVQRGDPMLATFELTKQLEAEKAAAETTSPEAK